MCGRYILVQKTEIIEKRFNISIPKNAGYKPSYNISPGKTAAVICDENPKELQMFTFGLSPFWSKKRMYLFNARSEGDRNKENDPAYSGSKEIIQKPAFRKPIRSQRCLVIADAFYEGSTAKGLDEAYLVYLKDKARPFAFAGIWDEWTDPESKNSFLTFAIITTTANALLQKIPHHRSPVILHPGQEKKWLNPKTPLAEITRMLKAFPADKMNAYPVSKAMKNPRADEASLIQPVGERLSPEYDIKTKQQLELQGMGSGKRFRMF